MASVGHIAVGMAAARAYDARRAPRWTAMAAWSALAMLPDLDVIGFALGVHYADPWGHRGAAHSLLMAAALGIALSAIAGRRGRPLGRTALFTIIVLASHGLLDTMTDGGLGCALLWPFSLSRYFAPWRPIPVAPIGLDFLSLDGAIVSAIELALFFPVFLYALRPRRRTMRPLAAASLTAIWLVSLWLIASGDPIREAILGFALHEDTSHASGFSDTAFRTVTPGMPEQDVRGLLGAPHGEDWYYPPRDQPALRAADAFAGAISRECVGVRFEYGFAVNAFDEDSCGNLGLWAGTSLDDARRLLGPPREACWAYTWSPTGAFHRGRLVCFLNSRVDVVLSRWIRGG
jgi:inner membrane protein